MQLIDGLYIEMPTEKLRGILALRAAHHWDKAIWYKQQVETLSKEIESNPNVSNNPIQSLRQSQTSHETKHTFFKMLEENLVPDALYRLSQDNCVRLELYAQYF